MKWRWIIFIFSMFWIAPALAGAEETYIFDPSETEKKPYHVGGYLEFKPILFGLDRDSAFYKLRFFDHPRDQNLWEANGRIQLEGSYEKSIFRVYAKTNTELKSSYSGESERSTFYELYGSVKPLTNLKIDVGKKTMKWGKGYAWSPVAFVDKPKDPDDPETAMEGYILATADYIRSFNGPLKTFSFTPVIFPVYDHVNDDFGNSNKLNVAGRFYFLLYDTDIDLMFLTGGSRPDRFGGDFSRNITTNFEVHGELAYFRSFQKNVLDINGNRHVVEGDTVSYVIGLRHLTSFDLTTIIEYYHNGTGFSLNEMENYYRLINQGYSIYRTTGNTAILDNAQQMAEGGYGRSNAMANYLYVRFSQKEPLDILYFTPSLTWMMNTDDRSWSLTPELLYTGFTNWEFRIRSGIIVGAGNSDFGEKQNDYRIELRAGYYF
ncbi:MAG: hypothetical protein CVU71_08045 [Deltaproteobacteria bacterium HGW-Deltaproteobacteria-6]|jgi:hypothetical protein|nr:MAG: hypothetical protein CVU71_08045 [Deltaproteobacteria bacterium HGW-Deltaproteobacteria-6]